MQNRLPIQFLTTLSAIMLINFIAPSQAVNAEAIPSAVYFGQGKSLARSGDLQGSLHFLDLALERDSNNIQARWYRGVVRGKLGEHQKALEEFNTLIAKVPPNAKLLTSRAGMYLYLNEPQKALDDCQKAIALNPNDAKSYDFRGAAYMHLGQKEEAEADRHRALELASGEWDAFDNQSLPAAIALAENADQKASTAMASTAIKTSSPIDLNARMLVDTFLARGAWSKAIEACTSILKADSTNIESLRNRGIALTRNGEASKALLDFNKALKLRPQLSELYYWRSDCYEQLHQPNNALLDINRALTITSKDSDYFVRRAEIYAALKQRALAMVDLNTALKLNPRNSKALLKLADMELDAREFTKAFKYYNALLSIQPTQCSALYGRAQCYTNNKQNKEALCDLDNVLRYEPNNLLALRQRSSVAFNLGQYAKAISDLGKVIELNPKEAQLYYLRGQAYANIHREQNALMDFSAAIKLNPNDVASRLERIKIYNALNDHQAALEDIRQCGSALADNKEVRKQWFDDLYKTARHDDTITETNRLLAIKPNDPDLLLVRARAFLALNKYSDAADTYSQILTTHPQDIAALSGRAEAFEKSGKTAPAIRDRATIEDLQKQSAK